VNGKGLADIPHLGRRLSRWLALQTMLGLGLVCAAVYVVASMTLEQHQGETLDLKQQAVLHLMTESRSAHNEAGLAHMLDDFLTGLDEMSLRITDQQGRVIYERLRIPRKPGRTLQRSFEVVLADTGQHARAQLTLDRADDDRQLSLLAWTLALAAVGGALLVSLTGIWLVRLGLAPLREVLASNLEDLRRMAGIVADMLFLSQADRGQGARLAPWASLAALADEVIDFHEAALQEAGLQVVVQGDAAAEVDARLLRRALSNLLGNATRYAQRGSTITVQIGARPCVHHGGGGDVALAVLNQGPSIDPAHLPRLFDRFYRADAARSQAARNHGLGLAIVAAIARLHGGRCFAESEGGFTRIGMELPDRAPGDSPAA
jgi:signal transduction histidine kinase